MKKIVLILCVLLLLTLSFPVYAAETSGAVDEITEGVTQMTETEGEASETEAPPAETEEAPTVTESAPSITEEAPMVTESAPSITEAPVVTEAPSTEIVEDPPTMPPEEPTDGIVPFGKWLWDTITDYALEIIATLSLTATAIGVELNKKQLFPKIASFMSNVGEFLSGQKNTLTDWKKESEKTMREWKEKSETELKEYRAIIDQALTDSKEKMEQYSGMVLDALNTVNGLADEVGKSGKVNEVLLQCLNDQEETLNTIVQSSTMAQWKKDIEGQRHAAHLAAMSDFKKAEETTESGAAVTTLPTPTEEGGEDA